MKLPIFLLAGGKSTRFGSDKARAELPDGTPLLAAVARALDPIASRLVIVTSATDDYDDFGLETVIDPIPDQGPIGGLHAALSANTDDRLLLVACDLLASHAMITHWAELLQRSFVAGDTDVSAFRDDYWHPLFALYAQTLDGEVLARIEAGRRGMQRLLSDVRSVAQPVPAGFSGSGGANTPAELAQLAAEVRARRSG